MAVRPPALLEEGKPLQARELNTRRALQAAKCLFYGSKRNKHTRLRRGRAPLQRQDRSVGHQIVIPFLGPLPSHYAALTGCTLDGLAVETLCWAARESQVWQTGSPMASILAFRPFLRTRVEVCRAESLLHGQAILRREDVDFIHTFISFAISISKSFATC